MPSREGCLEGETGNLDCFRINVNAHYFFCYRNFDLTTDGDANDSSVVSAVRKGCYEIVLQFSEELPHDLKVRAA